MLKKRVYSTLNSAATSPMGANDTSRWGPPLSKGAPKTRISSIQKALNTCKEPLVGLEYVIETVQGHNQSQTRNFFICVLCDAECFTHGQTMKHLLSFRHRATFLKTHFSMSMAPAKRLLSKRHHWDNPSDWMIERVQTLSKLVEKQFDRMLPSVAPYQTVAGKKSKCMARIKNGPGAQVYKDIFLSTFLKADVDHQLELMRPLREAGDTSLIELLPTTVDTNSAVELIGSPSEMPKPIVEASKRSKRDDALVLAEYHKRYAKMVAEIMESQEEYTKDPGSHPLYPAEWDVFWNARSEEFDQAGKDPYKHDFSREWSLYWVDRVQELDKETIAGREKEIRAALKLPKDLVIQPLTKSVENDASGMNPENPNVAKKPNQKRPAPVELQDDAKRAANHSNKVPKSDAARRPEADLRETLSSRQGSSSGQDRQGGGSHSGRQDNRASKSDMAKDRAVAESQSVRQKEANLHETTSNHDEEQFDEKTQDPVTVISVLRLLAAFEDLLGNSLGPRVVDLLSKAVALEKVRPNLSDDLLVNEDNNVLLDTVKEKMKGLLLTGSVEAFKVQAVRKVIAHVNRINQIIGVRMKARQKRAMEEARHNLEVAKANEQKEKECAAAEFRKDVHHQLATSIALQGKQITAEQLETLTNVYIDKHTASDTPYLFGLQMGSRFPDLPRADVVYELERQNAENNFGGSSAAVPSVSRWSAQNQNSVIDNSRDSLGLQMDSRFTDQQLHGARHHEPDRPQRHGLDSAFDRSSVAQGSNSRWSNDNNNIASSSNSLGRTLGADNQDLRQFRQPEGHPRSYDDANRRFTVSNDFIPRDDDRQLPAPSRSIHLQRTLTLGGANQVEQSNSIAYNDGNHHRQLMNDAFTIRQHQQQQEQHHQRQEQHHQRQEQRHQVYEDFAYIRQQQTHQVYGDFGNNRQQLVQHPMYDDFDPIRQQPLQHQQPQQHNLRQMNESDDGMERKSRTRRTRTRPNRNKNRDDLFGLNIHLPN